MLKLLRDQDGWSLALTTKRFSWSLPSHGIALLLYRPERRLSISIWTPAWSRNFRLWGPVKLSWEQ